MRKVNIKTFECDGSRVPTGLIGLADHTLQNLQAELNPVPPELIDIEFWQEVNADTPIDTTTHKYGAEILTVIEQNKTVLVAHEVIALTQAELSVIAAKNKETASNEIRTRYDRLMQEVAKPYTQTERETWFTQLKEADEYLADNTASAPMLSSIATNRGVTLDVLVAKIKENDNLFRQAIGTLLGQQQAELDAII